MSINQSNGKLKAAILGYGKMGQHHKTAMILSKHTDIVAVSDPIIDSKAKYNFAQEGIAHYHEPDILLKEVQPDVVHVCTPPETHIKLARLALEAGSHVYVEKPFAPTVDEAKSILSKASHLRLKVCAGHQVLFEEMALKLPSMIGLIGKLIHFESYFSFRQVKKNLTPVEQLMDILPHPVYLLQKTLNFNGQTEELHFSDPFVDAAGEVRCLFQRGQTTGMLTVTLRGRPVESYLKLIGDNGTIIADFVRNIVLQLPGPGASAFDAIINPYWLSKQLVVNTTKAFLKRALKKQKSYPGLFELINAFHGAIINGTPSPVIPESILQTVYVCEKIGKKLMGQHEVSEEAAKQNIELNQDNLKMLNSGNKKVIVTGGTGFLGKKVVQQLVKNDLPVRVLSRSLPLYAQRVPGAEYFQCDLGKNIPLELMKDVELVIHCAAETSGGIEDHQKNSINATENLIKAVNRMQITKLIFISSVAVLKSSRNVGTALQEKSPVDYGNLHRGPYVWGKAESERICNDLSKELKIDIKIIRPGPLVDFQNFDPPGRLGRKIGPFFIAMGNKKSLLAVCDVENAAMLITHYVTNYDEMPKTLNLLDPEVPNRKQLINRLLQQNPYLSVLWIPQFVINGLSPILVALQKLISHKKDVIHVAEAFASETYDTTLAKSIYAKMMSSTVAAN